MNLFVSLRPLRLRAPPDTAIMSQFVPAVPVRALVSHTYVPPGFQVSPEEYVWMPGELPGEMEVLAATVTGTPIEPEPEIVPCVKTRDRSMVVAEFQRKSVPRPLITTADVEPIDPVESTCSRPPLMVVAPL